MAKHAFDKFINKEPKGAKKKELIKQEKRKVKRDARELKAERSRKREGNTKYEVRDAKYDVRSTKYEGRKTSGPNTQKLEGTGNKPATKPREGSGDENKPRRPVAKRQITKPAHDAQKPAIKREVKKQAGNVLTPQHPGATGDGAEHKSTTRRQIKKADDAQIKSTHRHTNRGEKLPANRQNQAKTHKPATGNQTQEAGAEMPLNKFIAHAGVCARREAADLVKQGKVAVNGSIIYEPGFKVTDADKVVVKGKQVFLQHNLVYILLNKPKDYLTTAKDPEGRKTVFDIIAGATEERVFAVGRLDRNTTGVLLLTNDGELAQKLTHPSYEVRKIYEVRLDKELTKKDFEAIIAGVTLEDGFVAADSVAYADAKDKTVIGIEIHSGRNRIVRRIFEHLGYDVKGLDRVMFANLTKKNVDRGKYRFLHEKEVRLLKYMNTSFLRKGKEEL